MCKFLPHMLSFDTRSAYYEILIIEDFQCFVLEINVLDDCCNSRETLVSVSIPSLINEVKHTSLTNEVWSCSRTFYLKKRAHIFVADWSISYNLLATYNYIWVKDSVNVIHLFRNSNHISMCVNAEKETKNFCNEWSIELY